MSPASQGNLEVERYIGSCLISSSLRVNSASGKNNTSSSYNNVNYKGKKVADSGACRVGKVINNRTSSGSVPTCQDHYNHVSPGTYAPPGALVPLCECGGLKFPGTRYGSPGPNAGVGGGWAGMPLFSMAPSNSRRNRKPSASNVCSVSGNRNSKSSAVQPPTVTASGNCVRSGIVEIENGSQQSRTPLSRLAIHTQGAPLILAGRYNINGRKNVNQNRGPPVRQFRNGDLSIRRSNSVRDSPSGNSNNGNNNNTPNSDCLSVASDESSGHSENSLPRIIKPRKRRKKDRKPPPVTNPSPDVPTSSPQNELKVSSSDSPNIVTLKPYVPLCYELYDSGRWNGNRKNSKNEDSQQKIKNWEIEKRHSLRLPYTVEVERDDELVSQISDDDNQEPKLHHNFDDVEEEEGVHVDTSALFPYSCPPTICQCRYCDPSGLIWDVDQHCYSPFLTPPSPSTENTSFSRSPFANIPLFLTPPPTEVRSFDFLSKDALSNDRSAGLLRRSWSEPLSSTSECDNINVGSDIPRGSFGVIGRGRVNKSNAIPMSRQYYEYEASDTSSITSLSSSQSLEVSTEIVTSLNGHRDIEIKFYSSSPPIGTATSEGSRNKEGSGNCVKEESCEGDKQRICSDNKPVLPEEEVKETSLVLLSEKENSVLSISKIQIRLGDNKKSVQMKNVSDLCEQSAKKLEEEVDQLRLHVEE